MVLLKGIFNGDSGHLLNKLDMVAQMIPNLLTANLQDIKRVAAYLDREAYVCKTQRSAGTGQHRQSLAYIGFSVQVCSHSLDILYNSTTMHRRQVCKVYEVLRGLRVLQSQLPARMA